MARRIKFIDIFYLSSIMKHICAHRQRAFFLLRICRKLLAEIHTDAVRFFNHFGGNSLILQPVLEYRHCTGSYPTSVLNCMPYKVPKIMYFIYPLYTCGVYIIKSILRAKIFELLRPQRKPSANTLCENVLREGPQSVVKALISCPARPESRAIRVSVSHENPAAAETPSALIV